MRRGLIFAALASTLLLTACEPSSDNSARPQTTAPVADVPIGSGFDFYVLSLSWSPSYCEAEGDDANPQQCKAARPYAFVVHGLWPQFEHGFPVGRADKARMERARRLLRPLPGRLFQGGQGSPREGRDP